MSFGSQIEGSVTKVWPSEHEAAGHIASAVRKHGEMSGGTHSLSTFPSLQCSSLWGGRGLSAFTVDLPLSINPA